MAVAAFALTTWTSLTGCFSMDENSPARQAEQANFDAHMNAMTPAERIAYTNFLGQCIQATSNTMPQTYDIHVYNYLISRRNKTK